MRTGGDSGPAILPGNEQDSLLLAAIRHQDYQMPPDQKLSPEVIDRFATWIRMGAPDPRLPDGPAAEADPVPGGDGQAGRPFWAYQAPRRWPLPDLRDRSWPRVTIDHFILAGMESQGLVPTPVADRHVLIRRLSFDLIGLPPTPGQVDRFARDRSPDAYERLVDRLLASPHYGERLARLWLDVARYAEDQAHIVGNDRSLFFPNGHLYRDWVIDAFNRDLPYDRFVRLQLAADLVAPEDPTCQPALGFLGLGPKYYRRGALEVMADEWEDRVDTVTRGLLGLTVACARCHDHKYDPIPTTDYYALAGVFASTEMFNQPLDDSVATKQDGQAEDPALAMHVVRESEPRDLPVFIRGNVKRPGSVVSRRFLQALSPEPIPLDEGSGRGQLAEAIASADNPLTARVLVNRIWALHFGRGLVGTPSNFGALGEPPTHPRLLDDLAVRFMASGWSIKWLQRQIVLSAAYRQGTTAAAERCDADPDNRWLSRMNRRRLDIETWRDSLLSAGGQLDRRISGQSINPGQVGSQRRTIYSAISRFQLDSLLALFDFPDPNVHAARRSETTTPLQKLFVLNSEFMDHQARTVAQRLWKRSAGGAVRKVTDDRAVRLAYRLLFARPPTCAELDLARRFLSVPVPERDRRRVEFAHALLASNEMLFLD
jgi:hypothetical protein